MLDSELPPEIIEKKLDSDLPAEIIERKLDSTVLTPQAIELILDVGADFLNSDYIEDMPEGYLLVLLDDDDLEWDEWVLFDEVLVPLGSLIFPSNTPLDDFDFEEIMDMMVPLTSGSLWFLTERTEVVTFVETEEPEPDEPPVPEPEAEAEEMELEPESEPEDEVTEAEDSDTPAEKIPPRTSDSNSAVLIFMLFMNAASIFMFGAFKKRKII
jgi:hypothetical protein